MNRSTYIDGDRLGFAREYFTFARTPHSIPELDGLRAIAVLLVLARHAFRPLYDAGNGLLPIGWWDLATPFVNGWVGVDLFFVLSGFLITSHLIRRDVGRHGLALKQYFWGRALRIVPTYVFVLTIAVAGLFPLFHVSEQALGVRIAYHLLFLQDYLPANIVVSFWSLGVEEKFYILAPLLVLVASRLRTPVHAYGFLLVLLLMPVVLRTLTMIGHPDISDYNEFFRVFRSPFHVTFDGLIAGVICARLYSDRASITWLSNVTYLRAMYWIGIGLVGIHLLPSVMLDDITWYDKTLQPLMITLGFSAILLAVISDAKPHAILRSHAGLFFARISYPLYLVHLPLIPLVSAIYFAKLQYHPFGLIEYLLIFSAFSILAALVTHFAVEKPFLLLKDRKRA